MVSFLLRYEDPHMFLPIQAIVDTGSPITILGIADLKRARVSFLQLKKLESRKEPIAMGGGQLNTKILRSAKLKFENLLESSLNILIPTEEVQGISPPTILGVDFLIENKLKLIFNP